MEVPEVDPKRLPLMTRLEKKLADLGVGMRAKLISLFAAIKVLPLILLALLAWMQSKELGEELKVRTISKFFVNVFKEKCLRLDYFSTLSPC